MADRSRGKRRRGSQRPPPGQAGRPRSDRNKRPAGRAQPVRGGSASSSIPGLPWLIGGAVLLAAVVVAAVVVLGEPGKPNGNPPEGGDPASPAASPSGPSVGSGDCPTSQPAPLPAGETRTVTLGTAKGSIVLRIEGALSPIAAGNFVALAACGYYDGTPFHRTPTLDDGTPFVIQGGDPTGTGSGGPGYTIQDEPVTTPYVRGTVAMARTPAPNSVGSQFFIVLDDRDGAILGQANTYQIIGSVTDGMDTADAIHAASAGVELPPDPITITSATVANP